MNIPSPAARYFATRFDGRLLPPMGRKDTKRIPFGRSLTVLLVSQFLCILALGGQVHWAILAVFSACALWRALAENRGWNLPSLLIRLAIFAPAVSAVALIYGLQPTAGSLMALLIVLLSLKFLELRTARDFTVVALLGYFMVLSALFYNQDFGLCLYLSIAVLLNTAAMASVHLGTGERTFWPSMRLAAGLLLQAVPVVILLFIIFPRVQVNFLRRITNGSTGSTGMSDHLQPGSVESVALSTETAFRVEIVASKPPAISELYWRGIVLSRGEDAMSWRAENMPLTMGRIGSPTNAAPPTGTIRQNFTLFPQGDTWLYALDRPVQLLSSSASPRLYKGAQTIRSDRPLFSKAIYTVFSRPGAAFGDTLSPEAKKYYSRIPPNVSPKVTDLVHGWQASHPTPAGVAAAAAKFFQEGQFVYTMQPGPLPVKSALDTFLFRTKRGFCEHYAAAFCTLMRVAGVPARVVVGYQGGERNTWNGYYTVRQSDAHAWCEIWEDGRGWERIDPTSFVAPDRLGLGAAQFAAEGRSGELAQQLSLGSLGRLNSIGWIHWVSHNSTMVWESLDQQWNLMVIGYDPDKQFAFLSVLGLSDLSWFVGISLATAGVFSMLVAGAILLRLAQGAFASWGRTPDQALREAYDRFSRRLFSAAGIRRASVEGPLAYANRVAEVRPDLAADIRRIAELYVSLRYAPGAVATADAEKRRTLVQAIRNFRPRARTQDA